MNGTSLAFKGGKTLLVLLWKNADVNTAPTCTRVALSPQPGQTLSPVQAYGMLFARGFQNNKIAFLGLNLDAEDQSDAVMETLLKNSWPWPQAMAHDPRNAALASLASAYTGKPSLVVVGPDGEIKYAGALSGFLLRVMAAAAQSGSEPMLAMPQTIQKSDDANVPAPSPAATPRQKK